MIYDLSEEEEEPNFPQEPSVSIARHTGTLAAAATISGPPATDRMFMNRLMAGGMGSLRSHMAGRYHKQLIEERNLYWNRVRELEEQERERKRKKEKRRRRRKRKENNRNNHLNPDPLENQGEEAVEMTGEIMGMMAMMIMRMEIEDWLDLVDLQMMNSGDRQRFSVLVERDLR